MKTSRLEANGRWQSRRMCAHVFQNLKISNIDRRMPEPTKKDFIYKDKVKAACNKMRSHRRSTITIKSNPMAAKWATHKLEDNNTKEVF